MTAATNPRPSTEAINCAAELLEEIVSQARRADRHCFYEHSDFDENPADLIPADRVGAELAYLRDVICRLGWLADVAYTKIGSNRGALRGGAEEWMLSPGTAAIAREVSDGKR